ncbi:MAG: flagellar basal body P-ring formation chaperone FlgA [Magnetococcus sp. XQGC-1]
MLTPVLQRDFHRGEVVGQEDVSLQEVELVNPLPGRVRDPQRVVGKAVNREVKAGQPLVDRWLEGPVVVERGDRVRVTLVRGGLRIETSGVATQRGRVGESITVRNTESKSLFEVQITAPGEAQVRAW